MKKESKHPSNLNQSLPDIKRSLLDQYDYPPTKLPFLHSPPIQD